MVRNWRKGWIGVDLGTRSVKLAQVGREASGLCLHEALVIPRRVPVNGEAHEDRPVSARPEVRNALALGKRFSGCKAACALSMHWCQAKLLTVPAGSEAEQRSIVAQELTSAQPDRSEPQEFDFWRAAVAGNGSDASGDTVIALSVSRRLATQAGRDLYESGLCCRTLDGIPLALSRAVQMASTANDHQPVAAMDWGFADATFFTVSRGRPTFVRRLRDCGFGGVLQCICETFGVCLDEAEAILTGSSPLDAKAEAPARERLQQVLHEVAVEPLNIVVEELAKTLGFLKRQSPVVAPERMWLFGAGALWSNATAFLSSQIGLPVEKWCLESAGISAAPHLGFRTEILAPAIALSSLAWTRQ